MLESRYYRYAGRSRSWRRLRNAFLKGMTLPFIGASLLAVYGNAMYGLGKPAQDMLMSVSSGLCCAAWIIGVSLFVTAMLYADRPEVRVDDQGMAVTTLVGWHVVPWKDIQRVEMKRAYSGREEARVYLRRHSWLQRIRKVLFGVYSLPYVTLDPDVEDYRELVADIERYVQQL